MYYDFMTSTKIVFNGSILYTGAICLKMFYLQGANN